MQIVVKTRLTWMMKNSDVEDDIVWAIYGGLEKVEQVMKLWFISWQSY